MLYTYHGSTRVTLVNPVFHTDRYMDSRMIDVSITLDTNGLIDPGEHAQRLDRALASLKSAVVVSVGDAFILKLLEPKTGNTVHNFLQRLQDQYTGGWKYVRLGGTVPPDTINGYVVYVLPPSVKPSLEALGAIIAGEWDGSRTKPNIQLSDGKLMVSATADEFITAAAA